MNTYVVELTTLQFVEANNYEEAATKAKEQAMQYPEDLTVGDWAIIN